MIESIYFHLDEVEEDGDGGVAGSRRFQVSTFGNRVIFEGVVFFWVSHSHHINHGVAPAS